MEVENKELLADCSLKVPLQVNAEHLQKLGLRSSGDDGV